MPAVSKNMSYTLTSFAGGGPWSDISAGPVAQRLEQATHNRSVAGSTPARAIFRF
jgi:hypothetical protein